ncbi:MAG: ribosome-recycling factor [Pseudomonadota bacterium]
MSEYTKSLIKQNDQVLEKFIARIKIFDPNVAQPELLSHIPLVDCYGGKTNIKGIASIVPADNSTLVIKPWDSKNIKNIEKAIALANDIDVNTKTQGNEIYAVFPPMSQDKREQYGRNIKTISEDFKILLRKNRTNILSSIKEAEKNKELSKDELKKLSDAVTKTTQEYEKKINDELLKKYKSLKIN